MKGALTETLEMPLLPRIVKRVSVTLTDRSQSCAIRRPDSASVDNMLLDVSVTCVCLGYTCRVLKAASHATAIYSDRSRLIVTRAVSVAVSQV